MEEIMKKMPQDIEELKMFILQEEERLAKMEKLSNILVAILIPLVGIALAIICFL